MERADKKAVLKGDVHIWLKEPIYFLNEKWEPCKVTNFHGHNVPIIESDGRCYAAMPFDSRTITGILYETRNSFDELVAQYKKNDAGSNASETEE